MKLIDTSSIYEVVYPATDIPDEQKPKFFIRRLSTREVDDIEDNLSVAVKEEGKVKIQYNSGTATRLKIKFAVTDWKGIEDEKGNPAVCNDTNKDKLPNAIRVWLERIIDKDNGLKGVEEDIRKK